MLNSLQHSAVMNIETLCIINLCVEAHFSGATLKLRTETAPGLTFVIFTMAIPPYLITKYLGLRQRALETTPRIMTPLID